MEKLATLDVLDSLEIASPCPMNWKEMDGDERVRFCQKCQQKVFDLAEMTRSEAIELVQKETGSVCVRMTLRADGKVQTRDCPGSAAVLLPTFLAFGYAVVALLLSFVAIMFGKTDNAKLSNSFPQDSWFAPSQKPVAFMGSVTPRIVIPEEEEEKLGQEYNLP